jgi:hypothetical protein
MSRARVAAIVAVIVSGSLAVATIWSVAVSAASSTSVVFTSPKSFTTGTLPFNVAVADLNRDHIPDVVVANNSSNTVSVLIGNGDGTLAPGATYSAMSSPVFVGLADLNKDGIPDMAVAGLTGSAVNVLIGNGDGTFQLPVAYTTDTAPHHIAFGDFNRDGNVDMAVANNVGSDVTILLGDGTGAFHSNGDFLAHTHPKSIAAGDFNRDGNLDLVVVNHDSADLSVLFGKGDGTLQAPVDYPVQAGPRDVGVGDFNHDGILDLAEANGDTNTIGVLIGNADGTFQPAVYYVTANSQFPSPRSIAVADFNGDNIPDLVASNYQGAGVAVLLANGNGTFQTVKIFKTTANPTSVAVGDFNVDGRRDLAVSIGGTATAPNHLVSILMNVPIYTSPSSVTFAAQTVGTTSPLKNVNVQNTGTISVSLNPIAISGTNASEFSQTNNCPASLAGSTQCSVKVSFTPSATDTRSASLVIANAAPGSPETVPLTGTGK